ncbi:ABC transporter substrate-binding protein [Thioclava sp.]|uniref:ABC transporter substrate-binding protein n=1 Tax=Thioclava sp. TaxID=1933450 RepID=UPI003AA85F58
MFHSRFLASVAVSSLLLGAAPTLTYAETPPDTLIQAWSIDDIITLDPAEIFEFTASEIAGNTYETLIGYNPKDVSDIYGRAADSWTVSDDGKTIHFKMKEGRKFASGNPITAADAVFSLVRAVKLDKSPAFIIGQLGFTPDNVEQNIKQTGEYTFDFTMDKPYATTLALYCLTATVASVVDEKLVMEHAKDGDYGYDWLKTHYAGSGPFTIKDWRPNEAVILERDENYSGDAPAMKRVIYRHIPETSTQRLLLEKGDIDIARNLTADDIAALKSDENIELESGIKGTLYYLGLNQKNEYLSKPKVREAMKYLLDYDTIANTIMSGKVKVHQAFLPEGFLGAYNENPYNLNIDKAKELLSEAGLSDGFKVTMDTRNTPEITAMAQAMQQTMSKAGIDLELIPGDGKQTLTKYRARNHDIYIGRWGPDFQDPHTNASTFAFNPDNSDDATSKPLAWRNAWDIPELTKATDAAMLERDAKKRADMYVDEQKKVLDNGPFVIYAQEIEVLGARKDVKGIVIGPSFNDNNFAHVTK